MSAANIILGATGGGGLLRVTTFTSSGTWTKQADVSRVLVYVVGGGGNGGSGTFGTTTGTGGSGGGGGGYSMKLILSSSLNTTETITVGGATGTSSFGSHCSATGGTNAGSTAGATGNGGSGSGGDLNFPGERGMWGARSDASAGCLGGPGGCSAFIGIKGQAGRGQPNGAGPSNSGGGGSGGLSTNAGGAGGSGIVIIYEYGY